VPVQFRRSLLFGLTYMWPPREHVPNAPAILDILYERQRVLENNMFDVHRWIICSDRCTIALNCILRRKELNERLKIDLLNYFAPILLKRGTKTHSLLALNSHIHQSFVRCLTKVIFGTFSQLLIVECMSLSLTNSLC
jgi:hypothetical protein